MRVICIQNCELEGFGLIEDYFAEKRIEGVVLRSWEGEPFPAASEFDAAIVQGTPLPAYELENHEFLRREWIFLESVLRQRMPLLGICCGAQILARLLGAAVRRNEKMEIGGYKVRLTDAGASSPLFSGFPRSFPVFQWHGDTFDVPQGAELLAVGDDCVNQAFGYGNTYGLQFHLEVESETAATWSEAYKSELAATGKDAGHVIEECRSQQASMKALLWKLMGSLLVLD